LTPGGQATQNLAGARLSGISQPTNLVWLFLTDMTSPLSAKHLWLFCILLLLNQAGQGQSNTSAWGSLFVNGPFRGKWGLHLDAQVRSSNGMDQLALWLFRPGLQYQAHARHWLTLGYAYVEGRYQGPGLRYFKPEHRIWQQWIYQQPIGTYSLQHRIRVEQRFLGNTRYLEGFGAPLAPIYSTRLRYFNRMVLPWSRQRPFGKGAFGALQNEVFLHVTGKDKMNGKVFDQNRLYLALGYRVSPRWDLEGGYMRRDIGTSTQTSDQHTWQLAVYLRPD